MATSATVVDLLSTWLSDGVVDPQVIPWFPTCRSALAPPVRARLRRAAARLATIRLPWGAFKKILTLSQ